ncbi:MAG TPA: crosslink repair DNA glycosylase YcaQ family protein [Acidobacteriota bacterium]|nr:crosslink repair DNA glycosylase YcaQ family protein [Acidobacteriota bacterium]
MSAPTGSGKTLAAFLCAIDQLTKLAVAGSLAERTTVLYVSPLKALANDIQLNLIEPLREIRMLFNSTDTPLPEIRTLVRTGDTTQAARRKMLDEPPHILVTTPESLYILLTSRRGREMLSGINNVIVDEIHALARDKRGAHLALTMERLEALVECSLQRVGLSATQKPIDEMARFLVGNGREVSIVNIGHRRHMDLAIEVPRSELTAVPSGETWEEIYDRLADLIQQHRTTLVFVNSRRITERTTHNLAARLGEDAVAAHHGSLSRDRRWEVERRLKEGELKAVVATSSLELGIDIGSVDLVCQIGSPRSMALALQRIGRSGHWRGATPKGRFFATTRDDLVECGALVRALNEGKLDRIISPVAPLDILAQQIVAAAASREWVEDELFDTVKKAAPYARLEREEFDALLTVLSEGISDRRGRRRSYLHRDRVNGVIRGRRNARLSAITGGGAIPEIADYEVRAVPDDVLVGHLDEDFAVESMQGDIFLLGNMSWKIRRVESGVVRVEDARGAPPSIPFWRAEAPSRTDELSDEVSRLRVDLGELPQDKAVAILLRDCGMDQRGAEQAWNYVQAGKQALGCVPSRTCIVAERFFDEAGGMQLILHAPFGARVNRAWGLALRKRFCRSFNFELQAAATENGVLISLSDQHSFPLEAVFSFLTSQTARELLIQALLAVPMFGTRWRWNATRALAVLRFSQGRRVPPPLQRIRSDDLLASVFPEQAACLENIEGDIEVPDHPLVKETLKDCLHEAMDVENFESLIAGIESGAIHCIAVDTPEPSPFSHEILNSNPYTFLDDAPLEERRARAVQVRRSLPPLEAAAHGKLDPQIIKQVCEEVKLPEETPDEIHDALLSEGVRPCEGDEIEGHLKQLVEAGRTYRLEWEQGQARFWFAAERINLVEAAYPDGKIWPDLSTSQKERLALIWKRDQGLDREGAVRELVRARLESSGPVTVQELSQWFHLDQPLLKSALAALEGQGQILRGRFRSVEELEWCDRTLLARIHRRTLNRLRREIEPVSPSMFMRFLFHWQHLIPGTRLHGEEGLALILSQLQGFETSAAAWETSLLPVRLADYEPELLDSLCLSGKFAWARLTPNSNGLVEGPSQRRGIRPTRAAPIAFLERSNLDLFLDLAASEAKAKVSDPESSLSHIAGEVLQQLETWGASFLDDLVRTSGRLPLEVEEGLWELVAAGLVTADGFDNLRRLIDPRRRLASSHRKRKRNRPRVSVSGRWSLLRSPGTAQSGAAADRRKGLELLARQLLERWGIVFRELLRRESLTPAWRDLLMIYRLWEARGEIRGGRFVSGFTGEQFALPEAVDTLRTIRRQAPSKESITISAADPLNLTGIVLPGSRIRPTTATMLQFIDGKLVEEEVAALVI